MAALVLNLLILKDLGIGYRRLDKNSYDVRKPDKPIQQSLAAHQKGLATMLKRGSDMTFLQKSYCRLIIVCMLQFLNLLFWLWLIVAGVEMVYEVVDKLIYVS